MLAGVCRDKHGNSSLLAANATPGVGGHGHDPNATVRSGGRGHALRDASLPRQLGLEEPG